MHDSLVRQRTLAQCKPSAAGSCRHAHPNSLAFPQESRQRTGWFHGREGKGVSIVLDGFSEDGGTEGLGFASGLSAASYFRLMEAELVEERNARQ